jgi:hypothetical protein
MYTYSNIFYMIGTTIKQWRFSKLFTKLCLRMLRFIFIFYILFVIFNLLFILTWCSATVLYKKYIKIFHNPFFYILFQVVVLDRIIQETGDIIGCMQDIHMLVFFFIFFPHFLIFHLLTRVCSKILFVQSVF